jgi:hypothetical protein
VSEAKDRVIEELNELTNKIDKLRILLDGDRPDFITPIQFLLLEDQFEYMEGYQEVLKQRLELWGEM